MTRIKYQRDRRRERIQAREARAKMPYYLTSAKIVRALKLIYLYDYTPKQLAFILLFNKYRTQLPRETQAKKLKMIHRWRPEARQRAKMFICELVFRENPLLNCVPKAYGNYWGTVVPIPISYKILSW